MTKLDLISMLPPSRRRRIMISLAVASAVVFAVLAVLDSELTDAGSGTIAFELAGSAQRSAEIVGEWETAGVAREAAFALGLDYLYAPLYGLTLAWGCALAALHWRRRRRYGLADFGLTAAALALVAAGFDWIENTGLAVVLLDGGGSPWPQLALAAAVAKFALVATALAYAAIGGVAYARSRRAGR